MAGAALRAAATLKCASTSSRGASKWTRDAFSSSRERVSPRRRMTSRRDGGDDQESGACRLGHRERERLDAVVAVEGVERGSVALDLAEADLPDAERVGLRGA